MVCIIDRCNSFVLVCHFVEKWTYKISLMIKGENVGLICQANAKGSKEAKGKLPIALIGGKNIQLTGGSPHGAVTLYI
jgi:hypothetical protein